MFIFKRFDTIDVCSLSSDIFNANMSPLGITRRVPVQRAVEWDEIPYPYKVRDTTLRPLLNITIKSTIVVHSRSRSCGGGDCPA